MYWNVMHFFSFVVSARPEWSPNPYIIGGTVSPNGSFPFAVSIRSVETNSTFCGGALIHRRFILTAAHCVGGYGKNHVFLIWHLPHCTCYKNITWYILVSWETLSLEWEVFICQNKLLSILKTYTYTKISALKMDALTPILHFLNWRNRSLCHPLFKLLTSGTLRTWITKTLQPWGGEFT